MSFHDLVEEGISRIYKEDIGTQIFYLKTIIEDIRKSDNYRALLKCQAFYVPNEEYMETYFGSECKNPIYDIYASNNTCVWTHMIVFPIRNLGNQIVGFAGYNTERSLRLQDGESEVDLPPKYRFSNKLVFNRGLYFFSMPGDYEKALERGYAFLTDGFFDAINISEEDHPCFCLLGSSLNDILLFSFRFIDTLILAQDNGRAGIELYNNLKRKIPKLKYIRQNIGSDADDALKSIHKEEYKKLLDKSVTQIPSFALRIKPEKVKR
jgi:hypothetical protein